MEESFKTGGPYIERAEQNSFSFRRMRNLYNCEYDDNKNDENSFLAFMSWFVLLAFSLVFLEVKEL